MANLTHTQQRALDAFDAVYARYKVRKAEIDAEYEARKRQEMSGLLYSASEAANKARALNVPGTRIMQAMHNKNFDSFKKFLAVAEDAVVREEVQAEAAAKDYTMTVTKGDTHRPWYVDVKWDNYEEGLSIYGTIRYQFNEWFASKDSLGVKDKEFADKVKSIANNRESRLYKALEEAVIEWKDANGE